MYNLVYLLQIVLSLNVLNKSKRSKFKIFLNLIGDCSVFPKLEQNQKHFIQKYFKYIFRNDIKCVSELFFFSVCWLSIFQYFEEKTKIIYLLLFWRPASLYLYKIYIIMTSRRLCSKLWEEHFCYNVSNWVGLFLS